MKEPNNDTNKQEIEREKMPLENLPLHSNCLSKFHLPQLIGCTQYRTQCIAYTHNAENRWTEGKEVVL